MEPQDLPDLPDLPDLDGFGQDDDIGRPEPDPIGAPVEPNEPPQPIDAGPYDLDGLSELPDLSASDAWTPQPVQPTDAHDTPDLIDIAGGPDGLSARPDGAPIELDMDGSLRDGPDPGSLTDPDALGEVDLSLDPLVVDSDQIIDDPTIDDVDLGDAADLTFDTPDLDVFIPTEGNSWLAPGLIAAGIAAIGLTLPSLGRLRRSAPLDFAALLDELGIDARVEHLDLTGLEEMLAQGRSVLLSTDGSAGTDAEAVVDLRSVERATGRLVVADASGRSFMIDLERFEDAWSDSAHQVVVASGDSGSVVLVPVTIPDRDLVAAR